MRKLNGIEETIASCISAPFHPKDIFLSEDQKVLFCTIGDCSKNNKKPCCWTSCEISKFCSEPSKCMRGRKYGHVNFDLVKKYAMIRMLKGK